MSARDFSFLRRPKWLAGHVIVLLAIIVFVNMGFWQLRRLNERQEFNDVLTTRTAAAVEPLDRALDAFGPDEEDLELRMVEATGRYSVSEEIILIAKSFNGLSGHHVVTPLYLNTGEAVLVDRGWVAIDLDAPGMAEFAPPPGETTVRGVLRKTEVRGSFGPVDPVDGIISQTARVDLARIDQQVEADLLPVYIQLLEQVPGQPDGVPAVVALPEPSEGPHRGYAVQWFLFALVVGAGYPILVWRTAQDQA